jgi:sporulation protein YlmC with PRC-barrel domain
MDGLRLIHDVLDVQLCDRRGEKMGRVDSLVLEVEEGAPPRVAYLDVSGTLLAHRLHPRVARWAAALRRRWNSGNAAPTRIPWEAVRSIGNMVDVDIDAERTPALAWERWVREHLICRARCGSSDCWVGKSWTPRAK